VTTLIYGPVPSWRLGKSLGIDLLATEGKTCSFDCIYCQLGRTVHSLTGRKEFVPISRLVTELEQFRDIPADYATFSGMGEPTLASNLGHAIDVVKRTLHLHVAVLTNSSLMVQENVRQELLRADVVIAKLDAPIEGLFQIINRPIVRNSLEEIIQGIRAFRSEYKGRLALQMMFMEQNRNYSLQMVKVAQDLSPDEVQINTPLRPCKVAPLPQNQIYAIAHEFIGLKRVLTVYSAQRPQVSPLNAKETSRRRPEYHSAEF